MKSIVKNLSLIGVFAMGWLALLTVLYVSGAPVPHAELFAKFPGLKAIRPVAEPVRKSVGPGEKSPSPKWTDARDWIPNDLRLQLPEKLHATPGLEMSLFADNIVLTPWSDALIIQVEGMPGKNERRRWAITPTTEQVGEHPLTVKLLDLQFKEVVRGTTTLCVHGGGADHKKLRILVVGDSITHGTEWVDELAKLLDADKSLSYELLGTNTTTQTPRVKHEGYGGWTWNLFLTHYQPGSKKTHYRESSPFVFGVDDGKPQFDLKRYFREHCDGLPPDIVIFELGINDVFCLTPDKAEATRKAMDEIADQAAELLAKFHDAAPRASLGVMMPPQMSTSEPIFPVTYRAEFSRWRNRRLNHAWNETLAKRFGGGAQSGVTLIPTYASFDAIDGYPAQNASHPNEFGARLFGVSAYAWIKGICEQGGK